MAIRGRIHDSQANYPDPILGINLRDSVADVQRGQAVLMKNCVYDGGVVTRLGSKRLNATAFE